MNRKFLATLLMLFLVITGALSPVLGVVANGFGAQTAYAAGTGTSTNAKNVDEIICGMNVLCAIITGYSGFVQFLPHLLAEVSGLLLDYVVWKNLQSSTWTSQDTVDSFVVKGWKLVRDFSNLIFIFALFVVAFSLILNGAGTENRPLFGLDPKRTIARVLLMALLINFSFFMCRVIIEITNSIGNVFYVNISKIDSSSANQTQTTSDNTKVNMGTAQEFYQNFASSGIRSVSLGILKITDAQRLILRSADIQGTEQSTAFGAISWYEYDWGVYILILFVSTITGIFNFFLVYLFATSSIFLFSRIFGLYFLIILSPIAFVSTTIPALQAKEYFGFDDWFKQLTGLAFCLPIYLFFMYLAIFFLTIGENATGSGYIAAAVIILIKLVSAGMVLILGKKVSKDLSGKIGAMATNAVTGVVTGAAMIAGAAMTGGASAALRMGGGLARNAAVNAATGIGEATVGKDNVEAIRQRFGSGNFKSFQRLNNLNPLKDGVVLGNKSLGQRAQQFGQNLVTGQKEMAKMGMEAAGTNAHNELAGAFRTGKLTPRAESIAKAREEREKKVRSLNEDNQRLAQQMRNPNLSQQEKDEIKEKIKENQKQIWNLNNPTPQSNPQQNQPQQPPAAPSTTSAPTQTPASGARPATASTPSSTVPNPPTAGRDGRGEASAAEAGRQVKGTGAAATGNVNAAIEKQETTSSSTVTLTEEQTKQIATDITTEMRGIEKEMNEPATRLNKDRMQELESRRNNLAREKSEVDEGRAAPARLKSFGGNPVGALGPTTGTRTSTTSGASSSTVPNPPTTTQPKPTFGEGNRDGIWKTDLTPTQQDRVLRKAVEKQDRIAVKEHAQSTQASRTASLLSGITTLGNATTKQGIGQEPSSDFDQSGMITIPKTGDFGGIQIPNK